MLDLITRLLISAAILAGTAYPPTLSRAAAAPTADAGGAARPCPAPAGIAVAAIRVRIG